MSKFVSHINWGKIRPALCLLISLMVSGCGGGGSGGGSIPPIVTQPSPSPGHSIEPSAIELNNTPSLSDISATSIYQLGVTGETKSIGVVDSGVDAGHSELDGRVIGGGDWQGSGTGATDPFGHGTHVASIIAAAPDQSGIQGIAPLANIVSYRILNSAGYFGGKSANVMVPALLGDADDRDLPVINNSWASIYEINDLSPETIETALNSELAAYRNITTSDGPVIVWAAGNGSDNNVSIRGGLPYYFPELKANWLTVVAVDLNGEEPSYTNRCGVSSDWCITAPGGGDHQSSQGIEAAKTGGGYIKKSGTSMAAPLVSGALALVLEHMPNLSPRQGAARLIETANYDGLIARNGCTIETCSQAQMRSVFGHGMINVEAALQPIGSSSIVNHLGQETDLKTSYITAPSLVGDAIRRGLEGSVVVVKDSFDGAQFMTSLTEHIQYQGIRHDIKDQSLSAEMIAMPYGFLAAASSSAPTDHNSIASLIDIPSQGAETWHGYGFIHHQKLTRVMLGYGEDRQAGHLMVSSIGDRDAIYWYGAGLDQSAEWLDGYAAGGLGHQNAYSTWIFGGRQFPLGKMTLTAEALLGQTKITPSEESIIRKADIIYDSWSLKLNQDYGPRSRPWGWQLEVYQPPALRQGIISLDQPQSITQGQFAYAEENYEISLSDRQKDIGLLVHLQPLDFGYIQTSIHHIQNYGHQSGQEGRKAYLSYTQKF